MRTSREERVMTATEMMERDRQREIGCNLPCTFEIPRLSFAEMLGDTFGARAHISQTDSKYIPERILKSGIATIVFWKDGTKTIIKLPDGDTPDDYSAFTAALAKKIFGSNSKVKKVIRTKTEVQEPKKGDSDEVIQTSAGNVSKN